MTPAEVSRFEKFVEPEPNTGCFLWSGAVAGKGYGVINLNHTMRYAHRLAYEHFVGPIPGGLHIDHLCRQTYCVNPAHLEPVTPKENSRRGLSGPRPLCRAGHVYDSANTYFASGGSRKCRECHRLEALRYRRKCRSDRRGAR